MSASNPSISSRPAPTHLWIIGILALLWNAVGAFDFLATQLQLEFYMGSFSEEALEYFYGLPGWVVVTWAMGVFGAFLGSAALLARRRWAVGLFAISLVGILLTGFQNFYLSEGMEIMGTVGVVFSIVLILVAVFLLQYSRHMVRKGVLQ